MGAARVRQVESVTIHPSSSSPVLLLMKSTGKWSGVSSSVFLRGRRRRSYFAKATLCVLAQHALEHDGRAVLIDLGSITDN